MTISYFENVHGVQSTIIITDIYHKIQKEKYVEYVL